MMKPILVVMVGISGSGKSTFSDGLKTSLKLENGMETELVETDDIREKLTGDSSDQTQNSKVFQIARFKVSGYLSQKKNVIIDATSLTVRDRKDWINIGKENNAEIRAYFVDTPVDVAKQRNASRKRKVPDEVIDRQASKLYPPVKGEGFDVVKTI